MSEEMQQDSVECATQALEKYNIEKDIAAHIKKEFDKKYNPTWHCIVGRNFGSYVFSFKVTKGKTFASFSWRLALSRRNSLRFMDSKMNLNTWRIS